MSKVAKQGLVSTQTGTPYYASPEVWKDKPYDSRSDIWSLGCVLYEMVTLKPPFTARDMKSLYLKVIRGQYPSIPKRYSSDLADVIAMCLKTNPSKRPKASVLINCKELQRHVNDVKDDTNTVGLDSPKTNLLNTIKLPKKLLDISKRLPKANYCSPVVTKKKVHDIKIAKGLPEIFENHKPQSQLRSGRSQRRMKSDISESSPKLLDSTKADKASNKISMILKNRLYKRIMKPEASNSPVIDYSRKIKLPKIQRISSNVSHNYSVNYSCKSLNSKRHM